MKKYVLVVFVSFCHLLLQGQGGVNLNGGLVIADIGQQTFNPDGTALYGYKLGFDVRLNEGSMYFNPGLYYMRLSVDPLEKADFFGHSGDYDIIKGRFGLGFKLIQFRSFATIRAKGQASINYFTKIPLRFKELYPGYKLNEAFAGLDLGVGLDLYALTVDIEYEWGLVNMINKVDGTTVNMWRFSLGVFF